MINGHGDDIHNYEREIVSNFSSNVYCNTDLTDLQKHLCSCIGLIRSYPEPDAHSLTRLLAKKKNIQLSNILVTNGAVEAIYLIAQVFSGKKSNIIIPTFSEYEDACCINKHELSFVDSLLETNKDAELIWLCNPNNPDGSVYDKTLLNRFVVEHPNTLFIIDQSYELFADEQYTFRETEALRHENVIILHSMTKNYAIPGLRLGYITACEQLITKIAAFHMPWSVNQLAIEAGKYLLNENEGHFGLEKYLSETHRLMTKLHDIKGLELLPTKTHFFLCKLINRKAADLKLDLIKQYGILIRDASNFRGLDESYFRIATQSVEENNRLLKGIKEWIEI